MSGIFKQPGEARIDEFGQPVTPAQFEEMRRKMAALPRNLIALDPTIQHTDFANRLAASADPTTEVDDRRPLRPGSLPGSIGIPTPPRDRGAEKALLYPPPAQPSGQLSIDAGVNDTDPHQAADQAAIESDPELKAQIEKMRDEMRRQMKRPPPQRQPLADQHDTLFPESGSAPAAPVPVSPASGLSRDTIDGIKGWFGHDAWSPHADDLTLAWHAMSGHLSDDEAPHD